MSSSSTATLPLPTATPTPHLRAVRPVQPVPSVPAAPSAPSGPTGVVNSQGRVARSAPPHGLSPRPAPAPAPAAVPPAPPQSLLAALPEGATVVAALPQGTLPQTLLAQYSGQFGDQAGQPMVGYLVLVPAENPSGAAVGPSGSSAARPVRPAARGITVDSERRNAYVDGRLLDLTYLEFELLAHLTEHPQRVHTRDHLVSAVWGYGHVGDGRTVDVHVARLRRKLGAAYRDTIVTVRRVGYKYAPVA